MATGMSIERARLAEDGPAWRRWGPYLSERAWGTVREDYSEDGDAWDYLPARPRPLAGVPVERGRARRHLRRPAAPLLRASRSGTARTRSSRSASSGSTGPQGNHGEDAKELLVVPRLDADPLVDALGATSTRRPSSPTSELVAENAAPRPPRPRVRAGRHRRASTTTATGTSPSTTPRRRRTTGASGSGVRNAGPEAATLARPADAVVPQHVVVGRSTTGGPVDRRRGRRARRPSTTASAGWCCTASGDARRPPVLRERDQRARGCGASTGTPLPEGRHRRPRRARRADRQPDRAGHEGRALVPRRRWRPGATAEIRLRLAGRRHGRSTRTRRAVLRRPRARGRRVLRRH